MSRLRIEGMTAPYNLRSESGVVATVFCPDRDYTGATSTARLFANAQRLLDAAKNVMEWRCYKQPWETGSDAFDELESIIKDIDND